MDYETIMENMVTQLRANLYFIRAKKAEYQREGLIPTIDLLEEDLEKMIKAHQGMPKKHD